MITLNRNKIFKLYLPLFLALVLITCGVLAYKNFSRQTSQPAPAVLGASVPAPAPQPSPPAQPAATTQSGPIAQASLAHLSSEVSTQGEGLSKPGDPLIRGGGGSGHTVLRGGGGGFETLNLVQAGQCNTGGFSCTITLNLTSGNMVFVGMVGSTGTLTISDGINTYNAANANHNYLTMTGKTVYAINVVGGSTIITCADSSNTNSIQCVAVEIQGVSNSPLDQISEADTANTGGTGVASAGTISTTSQSSEIVIGMFGQDNNPAGWTAGTGFAIPANGSQFGAGFGSALEYRIATSTASFTPTVTETVLRDTIGFGVTFKAAVTGVGLR